MSNATWWERAQKVLAAAGSGAWRLRADGSALRILIPGKVRPERASIRRVCHRSLRASKSAKVRLCSLAKASSGPCRKGT